MTTYKIDYDYLVTNKITDFLLRTPKINHFYHFCVTGEHGGIYSGVVAIPNKIASKESMANLELYIQSKFKEKVVCITSLSYLGAEYDTNS